MQTLLVHTRSPRRLWRDLGPMGTLAALTLMGGMVASALLHPVFVALLVWFVATGALLPPHPEPMTAALGGASLVVLALGYGAGIAAGWAAARRRCPAHARQAFAMPVYWFIISLAAWRAAGELVFAPFRWNKTAHGLARVRPAPRPPARSRRPAPSAPTDALRPSSAPPRRGRRPRRLPMREPDRTWLRK